MEEEEHKICPNCKREIPASNFTIHAVHCARNIRVCPVCKEPVPQGDLDEHHQKFHKLLPCKQCGELVCGTDLEDHIRDSCGNTIRSCRFCDLELPRRELPAHENYCGVRTEQCPDCNEWVMIKYRQLHLDSNHGFLRLDDDPVPKKESPKLSNLARATKMPRPTNVPLASFSNGIRPANLKNINLQPNILRREPRPYGPLHNGPSSSSYLFRPTGHINSRINAIPIPQVPPPTIIRYFNNTNNENRASNTASNDGASNGCPHLRAVRQISPREASNSRVGTFDYRTVNFGASSSGTAANYEVYIPQNGENRGTLIRNASYSGVRVSNSRAPNNIARNNRLAGYGVFASRDDYYNHYDTPSTSSSSSSENLSSSSSRYDDQWNAPSSSHFHYNPANPHESNGVGPSGSGSRMPVKRSNNQPQINTAVAAQNKIQKNLPSSLGAVKKRPAPPPPRAAPPPDPRRDLAYRSAAQRAHTEQTERELQNEYNRAHGLPPVLTPAEKLERLRKMDALHNRELQDHRDYRTRLQGRVWQDRTTEVDIGNVLGSENSQVNAHLEAARRRADHSGAGAAGGGRGEPDQRNQFRDVKPMSQEEFMNRFKELQLSKYHPQMGQGSSSEGGAGGSAGGAVVAGGAGGDRFSEIKTSLRELRRGLNEVTAPYNNANNGAPPRRLRSPSPRDPSPRSPSPRSPSPRSQSPRTASPGSPSRSASTRSASPRSASPYASATPSPPPLLDDNIDFIRLPCEFCDRLILEEDLVQHQTGCRPDLARYVRPPPAPPAPAPVPDEPVIPCEFCAESLPLDLISEHQERCGREQNLLYPD